MLIAAVLLAEDEMGMGGGTSAKLRKPDPGCMGCHDGIEVMHPWDPLSCTDCRERTYTTTKNRHNDPNRLELNKFCPRCRESRVHREVR